MVVIGGADPDLNGLRDIISSSDGKTWTQLTASAPFDNSIHCSVAVNGKIWVLGGGSTQVWSSSDGISWKIATTASPAKWASAVVAYNGKMWVLGSDRYAPKNDVWYSGDGTSWTQATASPPWAVRSQYAAVAFNGKIWVLGGYYYSTVLQRVVYLNDVWYSSDGLKWTSATLSAAWSGRAELTALVHNGHMWVFGGYGSSGDKYDVWYSSDGVKWVQANASTGWSMVGSPVEYDGKIWMLGNEVWYSTDGTSWTQTAASRRWWSERWGHTSLVYNGKMWVIGGLSDVWSSPDGINWTVATWDARFPRRYNHASVVHNGKMWVLGGRNEWGKIYNDVWYSADGQNWTSATLSAAWGPRYGHQAASWQGKLWVFPGTDGGGEIRTSATTAAYSTDGTSWTIVPYSTGVNEEGYAALVQDGILWHVSHHPMSYYPYINWYWAGEVWLSDGKRATVTTENPPWIGREYLSAVSCGGKVWIIGGATWDNYGVYTLNDVWSSRDGATWQCVTASAPWIARWKHTSVVLGGKIWVLGGAKYPDEYFDGYALNDIWYYSLPTAAQSWRLYR